MSTGDVKVYKCLRCGWQWIRRAAGEPKVCAKCRSAYWNAPRKYPRKESAKAPPKEEE